MLLSRNSQCVDPQAPPTSSGAHHAYAASTAACPSPATTSTSPPAMIPIEMFIGGPAIPRSKSRALVSRSVSSRDSRCATPAGPVDASRSLSCSERDSRSPRVALTAPCTGASTCTATNTAPSPTSGPVTAPPAPTPETTAPTATVNSPGSAPRSTISAHHAQHSPRDARGSTAKNLRWSTRGRQYFSRRPWSSDYFGRELRQRQLEPDALAAVGAPGAPAL